jgi:PAS domain-containing protein
MDPAIASLTELEDLPIPCGICEVDGTIVGVNRVGEGLLGRLAAEVVGKKAWDIALGAEHIWDGVVAMARQEGTFRSEIAIATPREPKQIYYVVALREVAGRQLAFFFGLERPDDKAFDQAIDALLANR